MNSSRDSSEDAFVKNLIVVGLGVSIIYINGIIVFAFFKHPVFSTNPRYILYIHLVFNDIMMLLLSMTMHVLSYAAPLLNYTVCSILLLITSGTSQNSPLNLAGMAVERYIAICRPLHHPQLCSVKRTYVLIAVMWLLAFVPGITDNIIVWVHESISIFSRSLYCYNTIVFSTNQHLVRTIVVDTIYLSCVWMTLMFTYFNVLQAAKAATSDQVSARKARNTILLHGLQLLLCMLTYVIPLINYYFLALFPKYRNTILFTGYLLSNVLPRLLSPLIYGVRDPKILRYIRMYLTCSLLLTKIEPNANEGQS